MKKIIFVFLIFFLSISVSSLRPEEDLIPEHKDWLELVSPIITKTEREIFLKIKTNEERNRFIQIFWKQRDPLPDTKENEFYREYIQRVQYADYNFGRETSKKGSQTERGYFYLLLGPPLDRQIYATHADLQPLELWYYKGEKKYGLPSFFYLIFYQRQGIGEYHLYSPGIEGPEKLLSPIFHNRTLSRNAASQVIKKVSGELAGASLSYLPAESTFGTGSFSSETIISTIHSMAEKKYSDTYARNFLFYKDFVETEYSHNFIESNSDVKVFKNSGQFFLHWSLEPSKINFSLYNENYYSVFYLILRVENKQGGLILEKEEEIPLIITPENYKRHERQLFAIQDMIPLISGKYKLFFLLKNKTTKDFTSFQKELFIPTEGGLPSLSPLLLYHGRKRLNDQQVNRLKAFSFGGYQYIFNTQNNFLPLEKMGIFVQVYNLKKINARSVKIEIHSVNTQSAVLSLEKSLNEILSTDGISIDTGSFSLSSLNPGYYHVIISIVDSDGKKLLSQKANFILLSQTYPVVPWIFGKLHNSFPNPEHLYLLASQCFLTGNYTKTKDYLNQMLQIKDEPRSRLLLGRALYALKEFKESLTVVFPVFQKNQDRESAKVIAANYTALKDWTSALVYLEKIMEQSTETSVLNLAAECYLNLKQPDKALPLLQKSLELDPNQKGIKELEQKAKKQMESESHSIT